MITNSYDEARAAAQKWIASKREPRESIPDALHRLGHEIEALALEATALMIAATTSPNRSHQKADLTSRFLGSMLAARRALWNAAVDTDPRD